MGLPKQNGIKVKKIKACEHLVPYYYINILGILQKYDRTPSYFYVKR